ncbi:hypothetical protein P152DRAFT_420302 [Eremomyces bilateralis CBS 781.70]|uniref:Uncharacterized protein n=1 Tax=Eremomyces bilateralis CBS 781.70 TaxID=1392243 RepID=A0A6G1FYU6_9PEZI|nr:uncharacterized protein P152DRAFT_420302 [Eremomyces bilateralis CBS 781.70]KAF1810892.1 hypothetical protein P152DRAFT_420302 [Eremomyces bilateralis CBS 781.70]
MSLASAFPMPSDCSDIDAKQRNSTLLCSCGGGIQEDSTGCVCLDKALIWDKSSCVSPAAISTSLQISTTNTLPTSTISSSPQPAITTSFQTFSSNTLPTHTISSSPQPSNSTSHEASNVNTLPTSSTSSSPTSDNLPIPKGRSNGAIAGIAVACLLAGAVITCLLAFVWFRTQDRSKKRAGDGNTGQYDPGEAYIKNGKLMGSSYKAPAVAVVENYLPQPAEDDAVTGEFSKLRDRIKNHVQSYYHTAEVDRDMIGTAALHPIAAATKIHVIKLRELLLNPTTRHHVLRLYIGCLCLSRAALDSDPKGSFLPQEVATCISSMASFPGSAQTALFSKWKAISGVLLQPQYGQNIENDPRNASIRKAMDEADLILQLFAANPAEEKRVRNLEEIMRRATRFAFLLFCQPSTWKFQWDRVVPDGLVVFPDLLQLTNDEAELMLPPRVFCKSEVVRGLHIDG